MTDKLSQRILSALIDLKGYTAVLYPLQTGVPAVGVPLAAGNGAWGAYADIIAAGAITTEFWLLQAQFNTNNSATQFDVQVYSATRLVTLYQMRALPTAVTCNMGPVTFRIPVYCIPSDQIQGRAGGTNTKVIGLSLYTAVGL